MSSKTSVWLCEKQFQRDSRSLRIKVIPHMLRARPDGYGVLRCPRVRTGGYIGILLTLKKELAKLAKGVACFTSRYMAISMSTI